MGWIKPLFVLDQAESNILCFHFAGGSASAFLKIFDAAPERMSVYSVQLPGREERFCDPSEESYERVVDNIIREWREMSFLPFQFYGYSLGAIIAYEAAKKISTITNENSLFSLTVSGSRAPSLRGKRKTLVDYPHDVLFDNWKVLGGVPEEIKNNESASAIFFDIFLKDLILLKNYSCELVQPLDVAVTSFCGDGDSEVYACESEAWSEVTSGDFFHKMLSGNHFFIYDHRQRVVDHLTESAKKYI
ncbi:MAG: thioesterase II family protein [Cellvibrionaceae bacterium]